MLILHGSLEKGRLYLWAEKAFETLPKAKKGPSLRPKAHPFGGEPEEILEALSQIKIDNTQFIKGLVWLPTSGNPLPSNPLLGNVPQNDITISPWAIWIYPMELNQVVDLLFAAKDKTMLSSGVLLGKEFTFFSELLYFALSLMMRQRYLPSISQENEQAQWSSILIGQDIERLCQLTADMPSVARALIPSLKHQEIPSTNRKSVLLYFLNELLDFLIRNAQENLLEEKFSTPHDLWLKALLFSNKEIKLPTNERMKLISSLNEWQQSLKNTLCSPFKFCLKIHEPTEVITLKKNLATANSPWKVDYFLQAHDDPSLFVTTKDVWNPKGVKRKVLERPGFHSRQFVLTSLGMAKDLCPSIEKSLQEAIPTGFSLDSKEASDFFNQDIARLEDAGFGVICPPWWKKKKTNILAKAFVKSPFLTKRKQSIWEDLQMHWKVYLGDLGLSEEELYQLSLLKNPIIKMRGEWVLLNQEEISKAIEFLKSKPFQPKNALDLLHIAAGISKEEHGIPIEGIEASGWAAEFLDTMQNHTPMQVLDPPQGFVGTLRPYQLRGYSWMSYLQKWQLGACLADDMGLGKTPQTLAMILQQWEEGNKQPTLLICPTSLTGNWSREAEKFVPTLPIYVHHGTARIKENFAEQANKAALVITSYALLHRDEKLFEKVNWSGIILDEAQNIKNSLTKQTKAAYKLKGDYRLALTGTPVENNVGDLWSIMHFLNPGYLGSLEEFRRVFFNPIQLERDPEATSTLKQLTQPLILRRLKTDRSIISDLPEKMEMKTYCSLTPEQISLYETVIANANGLLDTTEGIERKGIILATLSKLKQICNHPTNFLKDNSKLEDRSGKLSRLQEMLEEIYEVQDRCLIFTQFTEMGELIKKHLEEQSGKEVLFLHGSVPKKHRDLMVDRFQKEDNGPSVFLLSLKAGGVGLNLTRANHVFHFDRWWNPAVENQATDRVFRIGQKKNVQVHKFICSGTIEEKIDEMIENKKEIAQNVVGNGEGWLTELSSENLKDLWKLRKSAL